MACTVRLRGAMPWNCRYGRWPLVAVPVAAGFSVLLSVPLVVGALVVGALVAGALAGAGAGALLLAPPKGFFQPPQELHADSESASRPARNTLRCVRFMINSSVVGVLQCVRDDAVPLQ
jgi:hypothetical protein